MLHVPEDRRMTRGAGVLNTAPKSGNVGLFVLRNPCGGPNLRCIASDGLGWEHVSVSHPYRCPTWDEMCHVKDVFWDAEDCVVQYHPPRSDYEDFHPFVLHLWRPISADVPRPPRELVGGRAGIRAARSALNV